MAGRLTIDTHAPRAGAGDNGALSPTSSGLLAMSEGQAGLLSPKSHAKRAALIASAGAQLHPAPYKSSRRSSTQGVTARSSTADALDDDESDEEEAGGFLPPQPAAAALPVVQGAPADPARVRAAVANGLLAAMSDVEIRMLLSRLNPILLCAVLRTSADQQHPKNVEEAMRLSYAHDGETLDGSLKERIFDGIVTVFLVADDTAGEGGADKLFNAYIAEEAKGTGEIEEELRERLLVSARTARGKTRYVKVGRGSTGLGFGLRLNDDDDLELCEAADGSELSRDDILEQLRAESMRRPAFCALVLAATALEFEWKNVIFDVVTGAVTPSNIKAWCVLDGAAVRISQSAYGMTGAMGVPLFCRGAGGGGEADGGGGAGRGSDAAPADIVVRVGTAHRVFRLRDWDHLICLIVLFGCCWGAVFDLHPQTGSGKCSVDIDRYGVAVVHGGAGGESNATHTQHLRAPPCHPSARAHIPSPPPPPRLLRVVAHR